MNRATMKFEASIKLGYSLQKYIQTILNMCKHRLDTKKRFCIDG